MKKKWFISVLIFSLTNMIMLNLVRREVPICDKKTHVILLGTGRSGSTSISHMLRNAGVFINGEHNGVILNLLEFERNVIRTYSNENSQSWFRNRELSREERFKSYARLMYPFICEDRTQSRCGFKEVRYLTSDEINFIRELFPCAKIIFNYRSDVQRQLESQKMLWDYSIDVNKTNAIFIESSGLDTKSTLIKTEDIQVHRMNELIQWLGVKHCEFKDVAVSNSGGWGYTEDDKGRCVLI